jgi:hypothetical protein
MRLSSIKCGDEPRAPDDDWHGLGSIGLFLGLEARNAKEGHQDEN